MRSEPRSTIKPATAEPNAVPRRYVLAHHLRDRARIAVAVARE
jgi:hypothetical protein